MATVMAILPRHASDAELTVPELLAELREARAIQRELLDVLHGDGEARTRRTDASPVARALNSVVPFMVGLLIGVLSTVAAMTGRISTLEEQSRQNGAAIQSLTAELRSWLTPVRKP